MAGRGAMRRGRESAFTLIELMIVVAIIGILASIALPKFAMLVEKARETSTKGAAVTIRSAVSIYYATTEGIFPDYIETSNNYLFSRFLESLPPVKATHVGVDIGTLESPSGTGVYYTTEENITIVGTGWLYNAASGRAFVNSSATDSKGWPYSTYGY